MEDTFSAIDHIYEEAKDFLIVGLTGRTGSGCSTAAQKLTSQHLDVPSEGYEGLTRNEFKKHLIIKRYIDGERWTPFLRIEASSIITYHLLIIAEADLRLFLFDMLALPVEKIDELNCLLQDVREQVLGLDKRRHKLEHQDVGLWFELYFSKLPGLTKVIIERLGRANFTQLYQSAGDNIRSSGQANVSEFDSNEIFNFPKHLNFVIKIAHRKLREENKPCRIAIDAIRNPYEAFFLKRRYANFYLVSINTSNVERLRSLREFRNLTDPEIKTIDEKEYPSKVSGAKKFIAQNVQECIEVSDIHIHNSKGSEFTHTDLVSQLAWYVTLMVHPGLVMPTSVENCMQIAYTAKQNSGCISRQVGAVVTDDSYSVKAVGWNSTPQGQTPCLLRSAEDLLEGRNKSDFSEYELKDPLFRKAVSSKYSELIALNKASSRSFAFCFKSIQNEIEGEKNQVHTRALHAEENAFMQIAKFGGQRLAGGILFTTASPSELCAKKAYQLGLAKIIYIDPYPGIATQHILSCGQKKPELELFRGAVGRAYYQLYQPLMPYKDELELVFKIPRFHNPANPSRSVLERVNAELIEDNKRLQQELLH